MFSPGIPTRVLAFAGHFIFLGRPKDMSAFDHSKCHSVYFNIMLQLIALHDKSRDGKIEYNDFIAAKKWINKNYLMSAFEGKKKKKKKGKKGGKKKGKFKLVMPICTQDEGPRTFGGSPPEVYIPHHIHFTDTGRFDRDHPPKHPLQVGQAFTHFLTSHELKVW